LLSRDCHSLERNGICIALIVGLHGAAEKDMKIYLLMLVIGSLLTAIHFTSTPEQRSKTLPH
jgi:hypothetical protein